MEKSRQKNALLDGGKTILIFFNLKNREPKEFEENSVVKRKKLKKLG